jgi:hypothetical protein
MGVPEWAKSIIVLCTTINSNNTIPTTNVRVLLKQPFPTAVDDPH